MSRDATGGVGGAADGGGEQRLVSNGVNARGRLRLQCAPLDIPELEASDMKLNRLLFLGPVAERRGDALHHQLQVDVGPENDGRSKLE